MPQQSKITSFIKRNPVLKESSINRESPKSSQMELDKTHDSLKKNNVQEDNETTPVKRKADEDTSKVFTPEQKRRMTENKTKCELIQYSKKLPGTVDSKIGITWFEALKTEFDKPYFAKLSDFLVKERSNNTIYPTAQDVWSWTHHFNIKDTKVVILGQDPYHGPNQAHGLCFSVRKGVSPPPSLVNMYKELENDIEGFKKPNHGDLTGWAKQGVLMLNACLTVRKSQANSHKDQGWEKITDAAIKYISDNCNGVVFLLWGSFAQKKAAFVNGKKHHLLKTVHPSPLSAHRGFLGCKHFSKCNDLLEKANKKPIDWTKLD